MPQEVLRSCESGIEFLKQPSSVHAYAEVEAKLAAKEETPSDKTKGFLQRKFKKFVEDYDEHHDWAGLNRLVLSEGISVWCCGRCCKVIEQNPTASFVELRQKTGCPLVQPEGDGGGGGSSVDEERQQALEDARIARQEVEELKAALAASKRSSAASEQSGATKPPPLPDLPERGASVTKTDGKVGELVSVDDLHEQTQQIQQQMQQQTQQMQQQMQQMQQQMQKMQQQTQQQTQQMQQQMQQQTQQQMQQMQQQTQELTGMLRTSKSSTSDSGSNRRPSVASRRPSRGSTSSLRPKEQARALSKGSKPTKATGPYLGGESNKKEGIKI